MFENNRNGELVFSRKISMGRDGVGDRYKGGHWGNDGRKQTF